ncbi:MAG: hypothetical protein Q9204_005949 [Flavoplaca sp. TL-2023a]
MNAEWMEAHNIPVPELADRLPRSPIATEVIMIRGLAVYSKKRSTSEDNFGQGPIIFPEQYDEEEDEDQVRDSQRLINLVVNNYERVEITESQARLRPKKSWLAGMLPQAQGTQEVEPAESVPMDADEEMDLDGEEPMSNLGQQDQSV